MTRFMATVVTWHSALGKVAKYLHCHTLPNSVYIPSSALLLNNYFKRTGKLISISLQLLFFFNHLLLSTLIFFFLFTRFFYLLVFLPLRSFLNDQFFSLMCLCLGRRCLCLTLRMIFLFSFTFLSISV